MGFLSGVAIGTLSPFDLTSARVVRPALAGCCCERVVRGTVVAGFGDERAG